MLRGRDTNVHGLGEVPVEVGPEPPPIPLELQHAQSVGTVIKLSADEWGLIVEITPRNVTYQKLVRTSLTTVPLSEVFPPTP